MYLSGAVDLKLNKVAQQGGYMNLFFIDAHNFFFFFSLPAPHPSYSEREPFTRAAAQIKFRLYASLRCKQLWKAAHSHIWHLHTTLWASCHCEGLHINAQNLRKGGGGNIAAAAVKLHTLHICNMLAYVRVCGCVTSERQSWVRSAPGQQWPDFLTLHMLHQFLIDKTSAR